MVLHLAQEDLYIKDINLLAYVFIFIFALFFILTSWHLFLKKHCPHYWSLCNFRWLKNL